MRFARKKLRSSRHRNVCTAEHIDIGGKSGGHDVMQNILQKGQPCAE